MKLLCLNFCWVKILISGYEAVYMNTKLDRLAMFSLQSRCGCNDKISEKTKDTGVDVMITIFCDFRQFSAKKWRFSQKTML
jgi:hypothetical protein